MGLQTKVIINEVTNLSDARYCAGMGVDYIGFRIDPSHIKYVDLANYDEITNWVAGIEFLGESSAVTEQDKVAYAIDQLLIDALELLHTYIGSPALWSIDIDKFNGDGITTLLTDHSSKIAGLILTSTHSYVSETDKNLIKNISKKFDVYLSYGITASNVLQLIKELPIKGLALKGGNEIRPGYKDYEELADIFEQLEVED